MSYFGKEYISYKNENLKDFVLSFGRPSDDRVQALREHKPKVLVKKSGDQYTLVTSEPGGKDKESTFQSGVAFDDDGGKTTVTVDGEKVMQVQERPSGRKITRVYEFSGSECVCTLAQSAWDGTAKLFFKAA